MTMSPRSRRSSRTAPARVARKLAAALTPEEIHETLTECLLALTAPERRRILRAVGRGTAGTIHEILDAASSRRGTGRVAPSPARLDQEWGEAWDAWEDCVADAADESGPFVVQEASWESPYFDSTAFSTALDVKATRIRKLWPRAAAAGLIDDVDVAEVLVTATKEISAAMPEWMSPPPTEDLEFGEQVTSVLLDALDAARRREGRDAHGLIVAIREVEQSIDPAGLDADSIMRFVDRLSTKDRAEVQQGIARARTTPMWKSVLERPMSHWFLCFQALNEELAPELGLELSRQNVASDWRLAGPVLDALRKRGEHQEMIELAARAMHSLLHLRDGETWMPTQSLLAAEPEADWKLAQPADRSAAKRILLRWRDAERAMGGDENAAALALQCVVLARPLDWASVLDAFADHPRSFAKAGDALFRSWRDFIVRKSRTRDLKWEDDDGPAWVAILVDAARRGESGAPGFRKELTSWLDSCVASSASAARLRASLGLLTLDLNALGSVGGARPRLLGFVKRFDSRSADVTKPRREWLRRLGASQLGPRVVACWRRLVVPLAPDPARSDYADCPGCLAVELDPDGGVRLLQQWSARYGRRRNLWAELRKRGIAPEVSPASTAGRPTKRR